MDIIYNILSGGLFTFKVGLLIVFLEVIYYNIKDGVQNRKRRR